MDKFTAHKGTVHSKDLDLLYDKHVHLWEYVYIDNTWILKDIHCPSQACSVYSFVLKLLIHHSAY